MHGPQLLKWARALRISVVEALPEPPWWLGRPSCFLHVASHRGTSPPPSWVSTTQTITMTGLMPWGWLEC